VQYIVSPPCVRIHLKILWIGTANATLISNGDFETGVFGSWKTSGDVGTKNMGGCPFSVAEGMAGYYVALGIHRGGGR
jgi:hypothetical protein